jgi:hypothetical protein
VTKAPDQSLGAPEYGSTRGDSVGNHSAEYKQAEPGQDRFRICVGVGFPHAQGMGSGLSKVTEGAYNSIITSKGTATGTGG